MGRGHTWEERREYANAAVQYGRAKIAREAGVQPETVAAWQREFNVKPEPAIAFAPDALISEANLEAGGVAIDTEELAELKAIIDHLADRCDGAVSRDDRGFGLATVRAGHYLAMKPMDDWGPEDLDSARSVAYIHRHQAEECGMAMPDSIGDLDAAGAKNALAEANSKVLLHFDGGTVTVIGAKRMGSAWQYDKATASHSRSFSWSRASA